MHYPLRDSFGRKITYLRLSVTDRCDFRCTYCMAEKMQFLPRSEILTLEESLLVARAFVGLGVEKIRLTGGEPLVRKNLPWLAARLRKLEGLRELTLTTNGSQLGVLAKPLAEAGVDRVNISLDSQDADTFRRITRNGDLGQVLAGLDAAIAAWGSRRIKLNSVLLRGSNEHEAIPLLRLALARGIDISFIEQMPLGDTGLLRSDSYLANTEVHAMLSREFELVPSLETSGGPARYWRIPGQDTRVGYISPHSRNFCSDCNRMRVTARGELFPCLGNHGMVDLREAARRRDEMRLRELILQSVESKPAQHEFDLDDPQPGIIRFMSHTGG